MRGKSKPKQLLNGSYLIKSGDDKLIESGNCKNPEIEKIKDFITLVGNKKMIQKSLEIIECLKNDIDSKEQEKRNIEKEISKYRIEMNRLKNIIETQINNSKRLELLFNENEKEKRRIEKEISISRHEMNRLKTSLETQVKNSEHLEVLFNENEKEKRSIEKEISTSRLEINRLQNIIENQKNYSKQLEFLFNKEVKILIKKSDSSKLIKKKHTKKDNLNRKSDNKTIVNIMSPVILLKNVQQK